jgi:23S rRNA (uracil1939-C5)-methyltransferase
LNNNEIDRSSLTTVGCGGCKRQILSYKNQLQLKEDIVKDAFNKLNKTNDITIMPIIGSPLEKFYRNKIEFSFGKYITKNRETKETETLSNRSVGFHKQ